MYTRVLLHCMLFYYWHITGYTISSIGHFLLTLADHRVAYQSIQSLVTIISAFDYFYREIFAASWMHKTSSTMLCVRFVSCFLLLLLPFCLFAQFYWHLCFLSRISCLFRSSSTFISNNRNKTSAQRGKQARGKSKKQKTKNTL